MIHGTLLIASLVVSSLRIHSQLEKPDGEKLAADFAKSVRRMQVYGHPNFGVMSVQGNLTKANHISWNSDGTMSPLSPTGRQDFIFSSQGELGAEVGISPDRKSIVWFYDNELSKRLSKIDARNLPDITQAQAENVAKKVLKMTGNQDSLSAIKSKYFAISANGPAGVRYWEISADRTVSGVPYKNQKAILNINAVTGQFLGLSFNFKSLPPENVNRIVTIEAARIVANKKLSEVNVVKLPLVSSQEMIVMPNNIWEINGNSRPLGTGSRFAWVFRYVGNLEVAEVWIDRTTGKVIGGEHAHAK